MALKQYGFDRRVIEALYDIHYLRWTPSERANQVLAFAGPLLLLLATLLGLVTYVRGRAAPNAQRSFERTD